MKALTVALHVGDVALSGALDVGISRSSASDCLQSHMPYNRVIYLGQAYGVENPTIKATACNRPSDVTHLGVTQIGQCQPHGRKALQWHNMNSTRVTASKFLCCTSKCVFCVIYHLL